MLTSDTYSRTCPQKPPPLLKTGCAPCSRAQNQQRFAFVRCTAPGPKPTMEASRSPTTSASTSHERGGRRNSPLCTLHCCCLRRAATSLLTWSWSLKPSTDAPPATALAKGDAAEPPSLSSPWTGKARQGKARPRCPPGAKAESRRGG